tara:strand:+ start:88 stop:717 length:630 start_codon:yes stop_codon:yes gene_type:complete
MDNETINFRYYNWGPLLYSCRVSDDRCAQVLELCHKAKELYTHELAGHLTKEYKLPALKVSDILRPYFRSYAQCGEETQLLRQLPFLEMKSAWVNFMEAGDFNPPHNHSDTLSFVFFLKVPDELKKEHKEFLGTSIGPGGIEFRIALAPAGSKGEGVYSIDNNQFFPKEGDLFIFPSHLEHWVYPFKSKVTRISVSGNLGKMPNQNVKK